MNTKYSVMALLLLTVISMSGFLVVGSVEGSPSIEPEYMVNATNKTITETLSDTLTRGVNLLLDIILAPFNAIATVFSNWGSSLSGWAGPIIAVFVIIVIVVMVRVYSEFDEILDLNS